MGKWKRAYKDLDKQELEKVRRLGQIIATHEDTINKLEIKAKRNKKNFDRLMELYNASLVQNDKLKSANTYLGNVNNINNV
jgi:multidrug resistance efflux pump